MANYSRIRREVQSDLGLTDKQMHYIAREDAVIEAMRTYAQDVHDTLKMPQEVDMGNSTILKLDPKINESFCHRFNDTMSTIFPGRDKLWKRGIVKSATYVTDQITIRNSVGAALYEAFIRHQIRSWNHPNLCKPPLNYLPNECRNPDQVTAFRETGKKVTTGEAPHPIKLENTPLRALVHATAPAGAE